MPSISTFLRVRPAKQPSDSFEVTPDEPNLLKVATPNIGTNAHNDGAMMQYKFKFGKIFGPAAEQEEIFDTVAKKICDGFLEGYNGTIFAYGQTGSGKTHTIEGSYQEFKNRGLLPRAIAHIYGRLAEKQSTETEIKVTYLEIYNDTAYDLLNAASGANARLPKVSVTERAGSSVVHNLSMHGAPTQELAQNLLYVGKTNRTVAKTSMNLASSRSHSIFTLTMSIKDGDVITTSKLNLVDLAGSERVHKSGAQGQQLKEAKHINLSLHYLESVIISLQHQRKKRHVPYRNSLLTKLLKDSLGGNCLTAMIATISVKDSNKYESISTCRFAQRVACVDNHAQRNEVLDDKSLIKQLRERIASLQAELKMTKQLGIGGGGGGGGGRPTTAGSLADDPAGGEADRSACQSLTRKFIKGKLADPIQAAGSAANIRVMFDMLRTVIATEREQSKELGDAVAKGEHSAAQLRELQQKFGVAQARLRNIESTHPSASAYGSKQGWKREGSKSPREPGGRSSVSPDQRNRRHAGSPGSRPDASGVRREREKREPPELPSRQRGARPGTSSSMTSTRSESAGGKAGEAIRDARERSLTKMVQLEQAEDDTVLMVQEVTERLLRQRAVLRKTNPRNPDQLMIESNAVEQLKAEQKLLQDQLQQLRRVRGDLDQKLKELDQMEAQIVKKHGRLSGRGGGSGASKRSATSSTRAGARGGAGPRPKASPSATTSNFPPEHRVVEAQMELQKRETETRTRLESLKRQARVEQREAAERKRADASSGYGRHHQPPGPTVPRGGARVDMSTPSMGNGKSGGGAITFEMLANADPSDASSAWNRSYSSAASPGSGREPAAPTSKERTEPKTSPLKLYQKILAADRHKTHNAATAAWADGVTPTASAAPPPRESPAARPARKAASDPVADEQRFISAFEKQRARVTKIRKSIQAAKTIQAAWRAYSARKAR